MSDPRYRDPRFEPPPLQEEEIRTKRLAELNGSNAMWGWVAGAVVLALVLIFVFARGQTDTASNAPQPPSQTTGMAQPKNPAPPATTQATKPVPSTTGQGSVK